MKNRIARSISMVLFMALLLSYVKVEKGYAEERYSYIGNFHEGLCVVQKDEKYGFIDKNGREIIPCKYEAANSFREGLAGVKLGGKTLFIDRRGEKVIESEYESFFFMDGFAELIKREKKWDKPLYGYMNREGKIIIPPKYLRIRHVRDKFYVENEKNLEGVLDKNGKVIIPEKYDGIMEESEGLMSVYKEKGFLKFKSGLIDERGKEVIDMKYEYAGRLMNGRVPVKEKNGKWLLLNKKGKQVGKKLNYEYIGNFSGDYAFVRDKNEKWGMIDRQGKEIAKCNYDGLSYFSEGLMSVRKGNEKNGKWGFINENGREVIKIQYDYFADLEPYHFSEGLAAVSKNKKMGFINKRGKIVIPFQYKIAEGFKNGYAKVVRKDKEGMIDKKGREIVPCKYESVDYLHYDKIFQARTENEVHLLTKEGKVQKKFLIGE